jgi:sugar lactone lactonase YvrE
MSELKVLIDNLTFAEGPRWHDGKLWFSDFYDYEVVTVDESGNRETIVRVPEQPSGLGWTPDNKLLIVSMRNQRLLRLEDNGLAEHADLSPYSNYWCNDMVVDVKGGAYIGNFGFNRHGIVITADNKTLIVAETRAKRLTAFDINADGQLSGRRIFAETDTLYPDGICLDADGAVWVSDPQNKEIVRFKDGGEITDKIILGDRGAYACMLGGEDSRTLFICTNNGSGPDIAAQRSGKIETMRVNIPGAGLP